MTSPLSSRMIPASFGHGRVDQPTLNACWNASSDGQLKETGSFQWAIEVGGRAKTPAVTLTL